MRFHKDAVSLLVDLVYNNYNYVIEVDGGINDETINYLKGYQIDNIISGSFVCMYEDYNSQINKLKI